MASPQSFDECAPASNGRVAFTIAEFCWRNTLSLGVYHKLKRLGLGPDEMRVNQLVRITAESELAWQRKLSHPQGPAAEAKERAEAITKERGRKGGKMSAAAAQRKRAMAEV